MQSPAWYLRRLRSMDAAEIGWRSREFAWTFADRAKLAVGSTFGPVLPPDAASSAWAQPGFRASLRPVGFAVAADGTRSPGWMTPLVERADLIARHRLTFFNLENCHLGDPIQWNRDHEHQRATPTGFSPSIDYRDFRVAGDCKVVWEPNRHHHLVVLGRAYRATGDSRFAEAIAEQLQSWLDQCPAGTGMNWRSPLELGIRLINWVWALDLVRESGLIAGNLRDRLVVTAHQHLWDVARKYSRGSSANNHRIGEAAGVFVGASYFQRLPDTARLRHESSRILEHEIIAQTYPNGCTREHAFGYHLFVAQFFLICGIVARRTGRDFSPAYWARLEKMLEFAAALLEAGGTPPMFGDADDGYVLDLGGADKFRELLGVGATLFNRQDFVQLAGTSVESALWLDSDIAARPDGRGTPAVPLISHAFDDAGYFLLQSGTAERISVFMDCADLGYGAIAAHGHADALSIVVRAFGCDVLVDPGTYDYFSHREWRDYFRSTRAHNTLMLDSENQSEMLGGFLWGHRATARCVTWSPNADGGMLAGEHEGYQAGKQAIHRRTLELAGSSRTLRVRDEVVAQGRHQVSLQFLLATGCRVLHCSGTRLAIDVQGRGTVDLELDPALKVETYYGSMDPIAGWHSDGYHRKARTTSIVGRATSNGPAVFTCRFTFTASPAHAAVEPAAAAAGHSMNR